jgi:aminobenzoyl-glutamate utilization protein B
MKCFTFFWRFMRIFLFPWRSFLFIIFTLSASFIRGQNNSEEVLLGKAELYKAKETALEYLTGNQVIRKFGIISDSIWSYAELGMQEQRSSALLSRTLQKEGFKVEKGVAGMPTCFTASWGSGKPVIGILGEFDALPMLSQKALTPEKDPLVPGAPGHGCGHNMMGTAGVAAAIAVKKSMEKNGIRGTIKFFGTPAEETLIGKPYMVKAGVFNDVDAVIDNHTSSNFSTGYGVDGTAVISVIFTFRGKTAHAGSSPWEGRSALDGVELMNVATNYLREHLYYTYRMHYVITEGGEAPNVVPDKASVWYYLRNTDERVEEMYKRVIDCAKGAALASGTLLDTVLVLTATHQKHSDKLLAETIRRNIELIGLPEWSESENLFGRALQKELGAEETGYPVKIGSWQAPSGFQVGGASTDVGEVSLTAPTATLNFPGNVPGAQGHHWSTVASDFGTAAWKGLNAGAKVMAAAAMDLLTNSQLLEDIKKEFTEYYKAHPYRSFPPEGAEPPVSLNKELMDKYRKAMSLANQPVE